MAPLVLHVEDDDGDAHLVVRCVGHWPIPVRLQRAIDGREAMDLLQAVADGNQECPNLVLLDLKLPCYHGVEVLRRIREEEAFRALPVVMLTSSEMPSDVEACRKAGCTDYLVKPMDYLDLKAELEKICVRYLASPAESADRQVAYAG